MGQIHDHDDHDDLDDDYDDHDDDHSWWSVIALHSKSNSVAPEIGQISKN